MGIGQLGPLDDIHGCSMKEVRGIKDEDPGDGLPRHQLGGGSW